MMPRRFTLPILPAVLATVAVMALNCYAPNSGESVDSPRKDLPESRPATPLSAREHLPIQLRPCGLVFVSKQPVRAGLAPGLLSRGFYAIVLNPENAQWWHADTYEELTLQMDDSGNITAALENRRITGRFRPDAGDLLWDGVEYECTTLPTPRGEAPPDWRPDVGPGATGSDVRHVKDVPRPISSIKGGLQIDLTSPLRDSMGWGQPLGSLGIRMLGHDGDYCVFDFIPETEGGYAVYRHRLPISLGKATLTGASYSPLTSFDTKDGRLVCTGSVHFSRAPSGILGWSQRNIAGNNRFVLWTEDLLPGKKPLAKPGANVTIRCWFYSDATYTAARSGSERGAELRFVAGSSPVLDAAITGMNVGGWRRARVREEVAGDFLLRSGKLQPGEIVALEFQLVGAD